jgi:hypothetical protein
MFTAGRDLLVLDCGSGSGCNWNTSYSSDSSFRLPWNCHRVYRASRASGIRHCLVALGVFWTETETCTTASGSASGTSTALPNDSVAYLHRSRPCLLVHAL